MTKAELIKALETIPHDDTEVYVEVEIDTGEFRYYDFNIHEVVYKWNINDLDSHYILRLGRLVSG